MKYQAACITFLTLTLFLSVNSQTKPALAKYSAAEATCLASIKAEKWESAETDCNNALTESVKLPAQYKREKMNALDNYAFSLFSQSKFDTALINYTKSLAVGKTFLTPDSVDLGQAYFNVGRADQGMASKSGKYIDSAELNYLQSEKIFRAAYTKAKDAAAKKELKEQVRKPIVLLNYIATMRGDDAKIKSTEAQLKELDDSK